MFDNVARANLGLRLGLSPKSTLSYPQSSTELRSFPDFLASLQTLILSSILDRTKVIPTLVPLGVAEFPDLSSMDLDRI